MALINIQISGINQSLNGVELSGHAGLADVFFYKVTCLSEFPLDLFSLVSREISVNWIHGIICDYICYDDLRYGYYHYEFYVAPKSALLKEKVTIQHIPRQTAAHQ